MAFPNSDLQVSILAYLGADPTAASGTWPAPVDLSARLVDATLRVSGGRQRQDTLQSMQATFELTNTDGWLTPLNPASPYLQTWDLGVPVALSVSGVGASPPYGLMRGYVASIKPKIVPGVGAVDWQTVTVTLGGVVRRLGMGQTKLKSALYRWISKHANTVGYWPLDEPAGSLAWRDVAGGHTAVIDPAAAATAVSAGEDLASWLEPGLKISANSTVRHRSLTAILQPGAGGALTFSWVGRFLDDTSAGQMFAVAEDNTFIFAFSFAREGNINPNQLELFVEDNGTPVYNVAHPELSLLADTPLLFTVQLSNSGANVAWTAWVDTPTARVVSISGTKTTAQVQAPRYCAVGSNGGNGVVFGSMAAFNAAVDPSAAFRGYVGETAVTRFNRLCAEEGIPATATGAGAALGPQPAGLDITEHLREIEAADHGLLYEQTGSWGVGYRTLQQRYALQPAMTVDLSTYETSDDASLLLQPLRDDSQLRNEWTVDRPGGGRSAIAVDAANQAKRGKYDDSMTVNVAYDGQTDSLAHWLLHETTYDGLNYGALNLDLGSNPALLSAYLSSAVGDRIDIVNALVRFYVDNIRLSYEGWTHTITQRSWKTQFAARPYAPYAVGVYGVDPGGVVSRYDTAGCVTTSGLWLDGASGHYASTPDNAALDITGDIDIRADMTLRNWASGSAQAVVSKWGAAPNRSYLLNVLADGKLQMAWSADGTGAVVIAGTPPTSTASVLPLVPLSHRLTVRATVDVNNGAGGYDVKFYTGPTVDGPWTQLGATVTGASTTSIFSGSLEVEVGAHTGGTTSMLTGLVHKVQIHNLIDGTPMANPTFGDRATGTTTFTDDATRVWTIHGGSGSQIYDGGFDVGSETTLWVATTLGQLWTLTAAEWPFVIQAAGARLTVTAVAGATNPQALTVSTTPANGVIKTISAGTQVSLAEPSYYGVPE